MQVEFSTLPLGSFFSIGKGETLYEKTSDGEYKVVAGGSAKPGDLHVGNEGLVNHYDPEKVLYWISPANPDYKVWIIYKKTSRATLFRLTTYTLDRDNAIRTAMGLWWETQALDYSIQGNKNSYDIPDKYRP